MLIFLGIIFNVCALLSGIALIGFIAEDAGAILISMALSSIVGCLFFGAMCAAMYDGLRCLRDIRDLLQDEDVAIDNAE